MTSLHRQKSVCGSRLFTSVLYKYYTYDKSIYGIEGVSKRWCLMMLRFLKAWFAATLPIIAMIDSAISLPPTVQRLASYCHQEEADKRCFHLYNKRDLASWPTAYELCLEFGQRLAAVPDQRTQLIMERFSTVPLSGSGQPHAWIAGRRTKDNAWRTLDEILFTGPVSNDRYGNSSCVVYDPLNKAFYMHSCRQDTPYLNMFVCQYLSSRGCLDASALLLSPLCYKVLAPTLKSPVRTWNGANQQCQNLYPEGTLAYSYIYPETEVTDYISQTMIQSGHPDVLVWIGIRRHPWVWVTESSDGEIVEIPFTYTNWWNQEGASVDERCAHLDLRQKSSWADKDCSVLSQYFVCEQDNLSAYDATTAAQTEESDHQLTTIAYQEVPYSVETNIPNNGSITNNGTTVTANKHGVQEAFIISVVVICAAVTMLVIGANLWDRKRSKRKKTKDVYFESEENSSGSSNFNAAFSIENGIGSGDKSTISHINIGRINTMALKGNSMLLRDHETASLAINPAYSSCSEQDPEENCKCPDVVSRTANVGCKKEDVTRVSGSTASNSLIQSLHHSDVSYGGHLQFEDDRTQKSIYD